MPQRPTYEDLERRIIELEKESAERRRVEEALRERELSSKRTAEVNRTMAELGRIISSTLSIDEVYEQFAEVVRRIIPFDRVMIGLINEEQGAWTIAYSSGIVVDGRRVGDVLSLTGFILGVFRKRSGDLLHLKDEKEVAARYPMLLPSFRAGMRSIMAAPLISKDRMIGVIHFSSFSPRAYAEEDVTLAGDVAGQIAGAVANTLVHAQIREAEEALRKSEEKFRNIFDSSSDAILIHDMEGRFLEVNEVACRSLGYSRDELLRMTPMDIDTPEFARLAPARIRVIDRKRQQVFEAAHRRKDGTEFPVEVNSRRIEHDGKPCVLSVVRDITERKRAERKLAHSHDLMRYIIEHNRSAIAVHDRDLKYVYVSQRYLDEYRIKKRDVIGKHYYDVFPDLPQKWKEVHHKALAGEISSAEDDPYVREDGSVEWTRWECRPWYEADGSIGGIIIYTEFVTERKKAEEEREKLQAQLLQYYKMESVGRLAGGVAHDLNNMLGIIIGSAEMAALQVGPGEPIYQNLQHIIRAGHRSADTVRQLLGFARKQTISPKVLDLNQTISGMLKMLRKLIGEDIELAWIPGKDVDAVRMDPSQLDQILANLVVNSRDALPGAGKITIESANTVFDEPYCREHAGYLPGAYVLLSVSDTGAGIGREVMEHLFEPFFTTKEMWKGTGLGLATVYGIVKQNDGFIDVQSEPGRGTTVGIYLPRCEGESVVVTGRSEGAIPKGTETILVAEDEALLLEIADEFLTKQGYTVLPARTPKEALSLSENHAGEIHLLLTDVVMPEMNGKELSNRLKLIRPELKCIFMSGYTADMVARHGVLDQGIDFIQKPFSPRFLAEKVRAVLDRPEPRPL
jgi:two-component system, cell cycle sensor histidine kinase and response regulator CckA